MKLRLPSPLLALTLATLLTACGSSPKQQHYTLQAPPGPALEANKDAASRPSIRVGPITVPEMLDRPQIVTTLAPHQVHISDTHRWAEPLKAALPRLVAHQLGQALPGTLVRPYDQGGLDESAARVTLDILQLEARPGQALTIDALWHLKRPGKPDLNGHIQVSESLSDTSYGALVDGLGKGFARISQDLARVITKP